MTSIEHHESAPEIDLVDVWLLVRRYLWLFAGVFAASVIAGAVVVALVPVKYTYSVTVNISAMRNAVTGKLEPVLPPDAETDALQNSIVPAVLRADDARFPESGLEKANVVVKAAKDGSLVTLSVEGTLKQAAALRSMLGDIVSEMGNEQDVVIKHRFESTKKLLGEQIAGISSQLAAAQQSRRQLIAHGTQTEKAFTLLLLDSQIARLQQNLFTLQQRLNVDLPADLQLTESVGPPERSVRPTSVGKVILMGSVLVVAVILGLLAVFIANLMATADDRRNSVS